MIRSSFLKNLSILVGSNLIALIINLSTMPIITRLYSPSEYGLFCSFMSLVLICSTLSHLQLPPTFFLENSLKNKYCLFLLAIILVFVMSFFLTNVFYFSSKYFTFLDKILCSKKIFLFFLALLLIGLIQVFIFWNNSFSFYKNIGIFRIIETGFFRLFSIIFPIFFSLKEVGLILARIIGALIGLIFLSFSFKRIGINVRCSFKRMWLLFKKYKNFPLYSSSSIFINTISREIFPLLLFIFYGSTVAGFYGLVNRVFNIPINLLGESIRKVFFQFVADNRENLLTINAKVWDLILIFIYILFPLLLFIIFFGDIIFSVVFGYEWKEAGIYSQIFSLMFFLFLFYKPLSSFFEIYNYQKYALFFSFGNLTSRIFPVLFGYYLKISLYKIFYIIVFLNFLWFLGVFSFVLRILQQKVFAVYFSILKKLLFFGWLVVIFLFSRFLISDLCFKLILIFTGFIVQSLILLVFDFDFRKRLSLIFNKK